MYKNKLLIANPVLTDPVFSGSVVFVFGYSPDTGAEGVILNSREVGKVGYNQILNIKHEKPAFVPLFLGGPCETPGIYFLHGYSDYKGDEVLSGASNSLSFFDEIDPKQNSMVVVDGFYFGTPDTFSKIIKSGKIKENKFRFFTGQAGWRAGQLEKEIASGGWSVVDPSVVWKSPNYFDAEALRILAESVKPSRKRQWLVPKNFPSNFDASRN